MKEFLRNIRCYTGIHRWEYKTERSQMVLDDGETLQLIVRDRYRCTNLRCRQHRWQTANVDTRRLW